jgi:hypothetical protein
MEWDIVAFGGVILVIGTLLAIFPRFITRDQALVFPIREGSRAWRVLTFTNRVTGFLFGIVGLLLIATCGTGNCE